MRINKIAAGTLLSVISAGSIMLATATPAAALGFADPAKVTPSTNLVNGQTVQVAVSGFPASDANGTTPMYVFECASQALTLLDPNYCDTTPADVNNSQMFSTTLVNGKAVGVSSLKILTGSSFKPTNTAGKCGFNSNATAASNTCYITVADTATQTASTTVAFAKISFKDTRAVTKTTLKAPKTAAVGKSIKLKIKTTGSHPKGKVVVTDKGKKIGTVKLSSTGTAKLVEKHAKKGKHKFVATYGGDKKNRPSIGKAKTTVK